MGAGGASEWSNTAFAHPNNDDIFTLPLPVAYLFFTYLAERVEHAFPAPRSRSRTCRPVPVAGAGPGPWRGRGGIRLEAAGMPNRGVARKAEFCL
jgi:hypothetical protein